jgi:hypothetical protein
MNLFKTKSETRDTGRQDMQEYICPAAYGILGRYFPGLESIASIPEMQWFPKVEYLSTMVQSGFGVGVEYGDAPSSQSEIMEYIAAATRTSRIIRTAKEKLGLHGRR